MADYLTLRRYYLNKRSAAVLRQDDTMESVWKSRQLAEAGTALPSNFPSKAVLETAGYVAKEDFEGADADELVKYAGLGRLDAESVIAALAAI